MSKEKLLAVAFTDLNDNDKYNPGKDALIAALEDTDLSGSVTLGDTVSFGTYPRLDGREAGEYFGSDATVSGIRQVNSTTVNVDIDNFTGTVFWQATEDSELFLTATPTTIESSFSDNITSELASDDASAIPILGPGEPELGISEFVLRPGDDIFLDVLIL
jgi:hypothetical protein